MQLGFMGSFPFKLQLTTELSSQQVSFRGGGFAYNLNPKPQNPLNKLVSGGGGASLTTSVSHTHAINLLLQLGTTSTDSKTPRL